MIEFRRLVSFDNQKKSTLYVNTVDQARKQFQAQTDEYRLNSSKFAKTAIFLNVQQTKYLFRH